MTDEGFMEYCYLLYVPSMLGDASVSIAAIVINPTDIRNGIRTMALARDWERRVRQVDPHTDLKMLGALLGEIRGRLLTKDQRSDMIYQLEHSFSNVIQVSQRQKCAIGSVPEAIDSFAREASGHCFLQRRWRPTSQVELAVPTSPKTEADHQDLLSFLLALAGHAPEDIRGADGK
jgi:hypothetical protein